MEDNTETTFIFSVGCLFSYHADITKYTSILGGKAKQEVPDYVINFMSTLGVTCHYQHLLLLSLPVPIFAGVV